MLFQPAIIALLLASAVEVAMLLIAAPFAIEVIGRWNIRSGSASQLTLERRTYLFSTLVALVLVTQLLILLLFIFNADRMAPTFTGAMCAVGSLNANRFGFPALIAQIVAFFLAAVWLAVNHVDTQAPDYPLVRIKYALLLVAAPALMAAFGLQLAYFRGLEPDVVTSCCSKTFSTDAGGVPADLAALPVAPAMIAFYAALLAACAAGWFGARKRRGGYLVAGASVLAFISALAGIVSFVGPYIYEQPNHHCPFCILKPEYGYAGYALYIPLFLATASGLGAGAVQSCARVPSLRKIAPRISGRLSGLAAAGFGVVAAASSFLVLHSHLVLID